MVGVGFNQQSVLPGRWTARGLTAVPPGLWYMRGCERSRGQPTGSALLDTSPLEGTYEASTPNSG
jgi:hypothetical protein